MPTKLKAPIAMVALPDLVTAGIFMTAWINPSWFGAEGILNLMLSMLTEVVVVFGVWIFCGVVWNDEGASTPKRRLVLGIFMLLVFPIYVWRFPLYQTWSAVTFGWLVFSRMFDMWMHSGKGEKQGRRLTMQWALAFMMYLPLLALTAELRLPSLGITPDLIAALQNRAGTGGVWIDRPQTILVFGLIYFLLQALVKFLQAWYAAHPEASWLAPLPPEKRQGALAQDQEGSRNAARNLAESGNSAVEISKQLQVWRGLSAAEADQLANSAVAALHGALRTVKDLNK